MSEHRSDDTKPRLPPKDAWQLFGLQKLTAANFTKVVNKILSGRFLLIGPRRKNKQTGE